MKKLSFILLLALVVHLVVSIVFILDPPFLHSTRLSTVYKTYLLPGPFFTESRIINNYALHLSWKVNGQWLPPINPARDNFNRYHARFNPADLYRSRLDRTFYLRLFLKPGLSTAEIKSRKEFHQFRQYLYDQHVPKEADSIRLTIINKQAKNSGLSVDTVYVVVSK